MCLSAPDTSWLTMTAARSPSLLLSRRAWLRLKGVLLPGMMYGLEATEGEVGDRDGARPHPQWKASHDNASSDRPEIEPGPSHIACVLLQAPWTCAGFRSAHKPFMWYLRKFFILL